MKITQTKELQLMVLFSSFSHRGRANLIKGLVKVEEVFLEIELSVNLQFCVCGLTNVRVFRVYIVSLFGSDTFFQMTQRAALVTD